MSGPFSRAARGTLLGFFGVAALLLLVWNTWRGSQFPSDDCVYAEVSRELLERGNVFPLTWQGTPFYDKGPLLPLLLAASRWAFGQNELALRFPSVLAGIAYLFAVVFLVSRTTGSPGSGVLAAITVMCSTLFFSSARRPLTDMVAVALASWSLVLGLTCEKRRDAILSGMLLGFSLLAKLAPGLVYLPTLVGYLLWKGSPEGRRHACYTTLTACAVALPWHLAMGMYDGRFFSVYFGYHVLERIGRELVGSGRSVYVDWILHEDLLVAIVYAVCALALFSGLHGARKTVGLLVLVMVASVAPVLLSETALPHYLLPVLLPCGMAVGIVASEALHRGFGTVFWVLVLLACVAQFAWRSAPHVGEPDYSHDTKEFCSGLRSTGMKHPELGTFDMMDTCVPYYCARRTVFYAYRPQFVAAVEDIPMLRGHVRKVGVEVLREWKRKGVLLLTGGPALAELVGLLDRNGFDFRMWRVGSLSAVSIRPAGRRETEQ